jgi:hypothetical protein
MESDFEILLRRLSEIGFESGATDDLSVKHRLALEADEIREALALLDPPSEQVREELVELRRMRRRLVPLIARLEAAHYNSAGNKFDGIELPVSVGKMWGLMNAQLAGVTDRITYLESHLEPRAVVPSAPAKKPTIRPAQNWDHPDVKS